MSFLSEPISLFTSRKQRAFAEFTGYIVFDETSTDKVTFTKHPVQQGASISDHAYKEPTELSMRIQFKDNGVALDELYKSLLDLQASRELVTVYTGKRVFNNMLISSLGNTTDKATENVLAINMTFNEILIVEVTSTKVPPRKSQANPAKTGATEKAGKKQSLLVKGRDAIGNLLGGG